MASKKLLKVGVLVANPVQLLNLACVDILSMATP